nr:hypothetical protein [Clostridia bacterium]
MNREMTMMDYILLQPQTLQEIFDNRKENLKDFLDFYMQVQPDHVYIIASGSSYNASCAASVYMRRALQVDVTVHCPSQAPVIRAAHPLVLAVSQGGESTNTIAAIKALGDVPVVAVTGKEACTINTMCDRRLPIGCRIETVGPKTMGYTATIFTFSLLALEAGRLSGKLDEAAYRHDRALFAAVPEQCRENIARTAEFTRAHLDDFASMKKLAFVGKGVGAEMAREGALKVLETLLVPAIHYEFEEYLHGPLCAIDGEMHGFYMLCTDEDKERMLKVAQAHDSFAPNAYMITGDDAIRGERVLNLVTSGDDATVPFEVILLPQFISSEVPVKLDTVNKGMVQFRKFDDLVKMKAKR